MIHFQDTSYSANNTGNRGSGLFGCIIGTTLASKLSKVSS